MLSDAYMNDQEVRRCVSFLPPFSLPGKKNPLEKPGDFSFTTSLTRGMNGRKVEKH